MASKPQIGKYGVAVSELKKTSSYLDILQQKFYDAFMDTFSQDDIAQIEARNTVF